MNKIVSTIALSVMIACALPGMAQQAKKAASTGGNSPHETTSVVVDSDRVTISYGRPFSKNPRTGEVRKIWGGLVPNGQAWRLGSDEATTLITQKPLKIGTADVPAGAYTLYLVPDENGAKLAISTAIGQWGIPVDEKHDLARVDTTKSAVDATVDQLTIALAKNPGGGGLIKITWENTQFAIPFTVVK